MGCLFFLQEGIGESSEGLGSQDRGGATRWSANSSGCEGMGEGTEMGDGLGASPIPAETTGRLSSQREQPLCPPQGLGVMGI